jgi:hypothetical protein
MCQMRLPRPRIGGRDKLACAVAVHVINRPRKVAKGTAHTPPDNQPLLLKVNAPAVSLTRAGAFISLFAPR